MMEGEMRRGLLVWIALMPMLAVANWTNAPFVPPSGTNTTPPATLPDWRALTFTNLIVEGVGHTNVCRIYAGSNVVGHDAARVDGIETICPPGGLHLFKVPCQAIGVGDPHAWTKHPCEVESSKTKATQPCEEKVDAENLG
jgi:hypothetical protein